MIKGIDISNNNWDYLATHDFAPIRDGDGFVIMKASEGRTYKDRLVNLYYAVLHGQIDGPERERLYGFYHYARPENGNRPEDEALNFWQVAGRHRGYALFALDVEGAALSLSFDDLDSWVYKWCKFIYDLSGVKPLIYCSASASKRFPSAAAMDCGLWVAKWGKAKPAKKDLGKFPFWALWQNSNGGGVLDTDYFNGTAEQFRAYAKVQL